MVLHKIFQVLFACALIGLNYCQDTCTTPDGKHGVCKNISHCPSIVATLNNNAATENMEFVKKSICGYRKVCCNDCYTPDGFLGSCVPPSQCPHIVQLHKSRSRPQFVADSICQYGNVHVCCGPPPKPVVQRKCRTLEPAFPPDVLTQCCGIDNHFGSKIIGGNDTDIDQYRWLVNLEYDIGNTIEIKCGGSLISAKYVVTAAHCVVGRLKNSLVSVRLGDYNLTNPGRDCVGPNNCNHEPISVPIEEIIPHPEYHSTNLTNDIALLRLAKAVNYTDFITPICLPWSDISKDEDFNHFRAYVAGWGQTSENDPRKSSVKQYVQLPLVNLMACSSIINNITRVPVNLWSYQICAGGEIGRDSCKGDSGGPLMVQRKYEGTKRLTYELTGVISYGIGINRCGRAIPAIYTNVFPYKLWIRSHIRP